MTTYTIINTSGEIEARGCSIETAAVELLGHDNHIWSIEPSEAGEGFDLWISRLGGGGNWPGGRVKSTIFLVVSQFEFNLRVRTTWQPTEMNAQTIPTAPRIAWRRPTRRSKGLEPVQLRFAHGTPKLAQ